MKVRLTVFAVVFLWWAAPTRAHRLDEYLQATTIAVEKDHLVLQLRLTPGVAVARQVLASLDANGDARFRMPSNGPTRSGCATICRWSLMTAPCRSDWSHPLSRARRK